MRLVDKNKIMSVGQSQVGESLEIYNNLTGIILVIFGNDEIFKTTKFSNWWYV